LEQGAQRRGVLKLLLAAVPLDCLERLAAYTLEWLVQNDST